MYWLGAVLCGTLLTVLPSIFSYRILGVFPHQGYSHFLMFESLMLELAKRGHQVVVLSRFPRATKVMNYEDVDVSSPNQVRTSVLHFGTFTSVPLSLRADMEHLYEFLLQTEEVFQTENFQKLWNSETRFDLVLAESFNTRAFYPLAHRFGAPLVAISSSPLMPWTSYDVANPTSPSYVATVLSSNADTMNFVQRLANAYMFAAMALCYELLFEAKSEQLKRKYLGEQVPPLRQLGRNISLVLVNTHFSYTRPRPLVPAIVDVGGLYVTPSKPLPENIEKFIDASKDGVVYFCMGSLLRGETFPEEKRAAFLYAFSKIPQRVLWKWEGDELPGKTASIMISKWMPQRDILAHPNVKLFISHGGLLGTSEAVYEGVPILGIPVFGDQRSNVKAIEASGAGQFLDYNDISNETILHIIQTMLTSPEYKRNAKRLSTRYRDRPMSPLDTAVYWVEHVIRHRGTAHLKGAAVEQPWYQHLLLDAFAFLTTLLLLLFLLLYYACRLILAPVVGVTCRGVTLVLSFGARRR